MRPFSFVEPTTLSELVPLLSGEPEAACCIAGGSDLLGLLKEDIYHYQSLVSLARIDTLHEIHETHQGLELGAMVSLTQLEYESRLRGPYRILAEAARSVATPEIRNQGTLGGNLCQRPRCLHYRSALIPCLKKGGTDCPALESSSQPYLAILGGHGCYSVHASDLASPLIALGADVKLMGPAGARAMPLERFFVGPEQNARVENVLMPGEVLTTVSLPPMPAAWRGTYLKARERTAGDFPLVSVAAGYFIENGTVRHVRLVLGGVAPVPWRSVAAEALLDGQRLSPELAARAAQTALSEAQPLSHNAYKVDIARTAIQRALMTVASQREEGEPT
jgi:xanthine dehydrogenase YagS FAD-binding subunit